MQQTTTIDRASLDEMLLASSRTFAINIPMLPGTLRDALTLGYLLLRNADTIEDAYRWPKARRITELEELRDLILNPDPEAAQRFVASYTLEADLDNPDYLELLRATPFLLQQVSLLPEAYTMAIRSHVARVIRRMQTWVASHDERNRLALGRLKELDDYCYAVAGIVGELITTLISIYKPTLERTRLLFLRTFETACGAGLQLTNIIKDVFRDHLEGRYYIPEEYLPFSDGESPEGMFPIIAHAYRNLCLGLEYACALPEDEVDIRKAVLVPLMLAVATLERLLTDMEALFSGDDVKISRLKVVEILDLANRVAGENHQTIRHAWEELSGPLLNLNPTQLLYGGMGG